MPSLALVLDQELAIASVVASTGSLVSVVLFFSVSTPVVPPALELAWLRASTLLALFQGSPPLLERVWQVTWLLASMLASTLLLFQVEA